MSTAYNINYLLCFNSLGVGLVLRKMGNSVNPTVELKKEGDVYTFTTSSTFKTSTITFKLGEEFDEETMDGRKVVSVCTLEGNTLTQEQKGDKPSTIIREFSDSELITVSIWTFFKFMLLIYFVFKLQTLTVGDIKCVRVYKAV